MVVDFKLIKDSIRIISRYAKKYRDLKNESYILKDYEAVKKYKKEENALYKIKNKAIETALRDKIIKIRGYRIGDYNKKLVEYVDSTGGYIFHSIEELNVSNNINQGQKHFSSKGRKCTHCNNKKEKYLGEFIKNKKDYKISEKGLVKAINILNRYINTRGFIESALQEFINNNQEEFKLKKRTINKDELIKMAYKAIRLEASKDEILLNMRKKRKYIVTHI